MAAAIVIAAVSSFACSDATNPVVPVTPVAEASASVSLVVEGLPSGLAADIELRSGQSVQRITASGTYRALPSGVYTIRVLPVENASARFGSSLATQQVTLAPGDTRTITVVYVQTTGQLTVALEGLTPGIGSTISVAGPAGFSAQLTQADTLRKLTPGAYTITVAPVDGSPRWIPDSATRTINVDSARVTSVIVRFKPLVSLTIEIEGLPTGVVAPAVDVSGPAPTQRLTGSATLTDLPIGTYVITPLAVSGGGYAYVAAAQTVTLTATGPKFVLVRYARQDGQLEVQIVNGPATLRGAKAPIVTITGPNRTFAVSSDTTLTGLPFGTYTYSIVAPTWDVASLNGSVRYVNGIRYSSTLEGRTDLTVTLDAAHRTATVIAPLELVHGAVTFRAPGASVPPVANGGMGPTILVANATVIGGFVQDSAVAGRIPPGTYKASPGIVGAAPNYDWPEIHDATLTLSAEHPLADVVIPYHRLVWPTIIIDHAGLPPGGYVMFEVRSMGFAPSVQVHPSPQTLAPWDISFPTPHRVTVLMPFVSGDTAAWKASPSTIDFHPQEGRTSHITIQMRPSNIMKVVVSGNPYVSQSSSLTRGQMSVTLPSGATVDLEDFSNIGGTIVMPDRPAGTYVFRANPVVASGVTYVPDVPVQTVSLPEVGRVLVEIRYTRR